MAPVHLGKGDGVLRVAKAGSVRAGPREIGPGIRRSDAGCRRPQSLYSDLAHGL